MMNSHRIAICGLIWLLPVVTMAGPADSEIQYLLESIGQSECVFVRNGKAHDATEAESHLRMKYDSARSHVDDSEEFIERIASKSSWSEKPYLIDCPDADRQRSRDWLLEKLAAYRHANSQQSLPPQNSSAP